MPEMPDIQRLMMEDYKKRLRDAADCNSPAVLGNRYPWQIQIAVRALLEKAANERAEVKILSGCIAGEFHEKGTADLLRECLKQGCEVRVAVWSDVSEAVDDSILRLEADFPGQFELRWSEEAGVLAERLPHSIIVGDHAYRQEAPHASTLDADWSDFSPEIPARICFNDRDGARPQIELFETVWKYCHPFQGKN
jgi:hypothetical protein